jgi:hypothetical protein
MKIRTAFVSNSSSSSFVIAKQYLSPEQIEKIKNHGEVGEEMGIDNATSDRWEINEIDDMISGETWMDNFDMKEFLEKIGVPMDKVEWGEIPMMGFVNDFLIPHMKQDDEFVETLKEEVEEYTGSGKAELEMFLEWVKEKRGMK